MAALLAVGIGLGAEKLGRTISDKRLKRKEKKAIEQHDATYGSSSSAPPRPITTKERNKKREDAMRELREARDITSPRPRSTKEKRDDALRELQEARESTSPPGPMTTAERREAALREFHEARSGTSSPDPPPRGASTRGTSFRGILSRGTSSRDTPSHGVPQYVAEPQDMSEERVSEEPPPPSYEEAVREGAGRA